MKLLKILASATLAVGYVGAIGMLLILIISHSSISDIISYCGSLVMLGLFGTFLFISVNRELSIHPHILFLTIGFAIFFLGRIIDNEFQFLGLLLILLSGLSVCVWNKPKDHIVFSAAFVIIGIISVIILIKYAEIALLIPYLVGGGIMTGYYWIRYFRIRSAEKTEQDMKAWISGFESNYQDSDLLEALLNRIQHESEKSYQRICSIEIFSDRMIITALTHGNDTVLVTSFRDLNCSTTELPDIMNVRAFANVLKMRLGEKYRIAGRQNPNSACIEL